MHGLWWMFYNRIALNMKFITLFQVRVIDLVLNRLSRSITQICIIHQALNYISVFRTGVLWGDPCWGCCCGVLNCDSLEPVEGWAGATPMGGWPPPDGCRDKLRPGPAAAAAADWLPKYWAAVGPPAAAACCRALCRIQAWNMSSPPPFLLPLPRCWGDEEEHNVHGHSTLIVLKGSGTNLTIQYEKYFYLDSQKFILQTQPCQRLTSISLYLL